MSQGLLLVVSCFLSVFILFMYFSFGWFSDNRSVDGTGMQVVVKGPDYEILTLENGSNGIYYDDYHAGVKDSSSMIWQMTDESNMSNYDNSESNNSIHPGSYGVVSFYVRPFKDSIDLDFTFEIIGYAAEENNNEITMTQLDSSDSPAQYLNGHILLFETRGGTDGDYTYSNPITSNEEMKRIVSEKEYTGSGEATLVNIYWVWPQTLSDLVDARSCTKVDVSKTPFTYADTTSYNAVVNNIINYPDFYFDGVDRPTDDSEKLSATDIATDYNVYGDYYDRADNEIGMGVNYVVLKVSTNVSLEE
ncbi:MAG: hypothetical protein K6F14_08075 [Clostridiales bacterium]|nr:hypothetical protein [Clostridiales bacterium]